MPHKPVGEAGRGIMGFMVLEKFSLDETRDPRRVADRIYAVLNGLLATAVEREGLDVIFARVLRRAAGVLPFMVAEEALWVEVSPRSGDAFPVSVPRPVGGWCHQEGVVWVMDCDAVLDYLAEHLAAAFR